MIAGTAAGFSFNVNDWLAVEELELNDRLGPGREILGTWHIVSYAAGSQGVWGSEGTAAYL